MTDRILTPQQELFLSHYTDPKSDTFGNARQSALKAEYSDEYSQNMTGQLPDWLSDYISDYRLLNKAERNLNKFLDDDDNKTIQADITKFIASRLGKKKYSERTEITGVDGKDLFTSDEKKQAEQAIKNIID